VINRRFEDIEKSDIDGLVERQVVEHRTLDYKEALPRDIREFLADVTSFANAGGGDIVFGIEDQRDDQGRATGIPGRIVGLESINTDAEILTLQNTCRDSISPRINGLRFKHVVGFDGGPIIVLRVARSYNSPHMVNQTWRFFTRDSSGKHPMDVTELRSSFVASEALPERIARFRNERLARIVADEVPAGIETASRLVLHIVPASSFAVAASRDLRAVEPQDVPVFGGSYNWRLNFDGLLVFNQPRYYTQLHRNGLIEAVDGAALGYANAMGQHFVDTGWFEARLQQALSKYRDLSRKLELDPAYIVLVALLGVKGFRLGGMGSQLGLDSYAIDREDLIFPDVVVEDADASEEEILAPLFNMLWQAAGVRASYRQDDAGRWRAPESG
jgi:hypothetical protein